MASVLFSFVFLLAGCVAPESEHDSSHWSPLANPERFYEEHLAASSNGHNVMIVSFRPSNLTEIVYRSNFDWHYDDARMWTAFQGRPFNLTGETMFFRDLNEAADATCDPVEETPIIDCPPVGTRERWSPGARSGAEPVQQLIVAGVPGASASTIEMGIWTDEPLLAVHIWRGNATVTILDVQQDGQHAVGQAATHLVSPSLVFIDRVGTSAIERYSLTTANRTLAFEALGGGEVASAAGQGQRPLVWAPAGPLDVELTGRVTGDGAWGFYLVVIAGVDLAEFS